jgi:hypothetical protein
VEVSKAQIEAVNSAYTAKSWAEGKSDPTKRAVLIERTLEFVTCRNKTTSGMGCFSRSQKVLSDFHPGTQSSTNELQLAGMEDFEKAEEDWLGNIIQLFKKEYQEITGKSTEPGTANDDAFEAWMVAERDKALASASAKYKGRRASGEKVDKATYREVLADRCYFCGAKATPFKALKTCKRCKKALYCDEKCHKRAWPEYKTACEKHAEA